MVIKILICIVFCVLSEFLTYKFIKRIDKKERRKLQRWEADFVEKMKPKIEEIDKEYKEFLKDKEAAAKLKEEHVK